MTPSRHCQVAAQRIYVSGEADNVKSLFTRTRTRVNQRAEGGPSQSPSRPATRILTNRRYAFYLALTLLLPLLVVFIIEVTLRVAAPSYDLSLFVRAPVANGDYLVANRSVGERWFSGIDHPPTPAHEVFLRSKPTRAFRVFVMGESAAAGFPYPRNAEFSRLLADVLRDVLPGDSVEVVNLAIAATNSFALLDMAEEVAAQRPDAVLIYAGHNEYYGVLGAASRVTVPGGVTAVRLYMRLMRMRLVVALRNAIARVMSRGREKGGDPEAASLMELLASDRQIPLGSSRYDAGASQFASNLESICRLFERNGIPVLVGSPASNLRDQPPFAADANAGSGSADSAFAAGRAAFLAGDTIVADSLFTRARDLDVVRFRAPSEFNRIIRRVSDRTGAIYVPVTEAFAAASPGGAPGSNIFLEHVHPTRAGQALIARVFFESLLRSGLLGQQFDTTRLRSWDEYGRTMGLTPFDERIAYHTTRTLKSRWPFVPIAQQVDYRGKYVPTSRLDSLAFAVSAGERWEIAKLRLAADYERRNQFDSAVAEYAGLARDAPLVSEPLLFMARDLNLAGRHNEAEAALRRAVGIRPTAPALNALGVSAAKRRQIPEAIALFQRSLEIEPAQPDVLYQLSLSYGMSRDLPNARATAIRLARLEPRYPRLGELLSTLGVRP
jgi:tetratricopeptide (TPR) repeat protein